MSSNNSNSQPTAIGSRPTVFPQVADLIEKTDTKTILDCPAGRGPMVTELKKRGYDVRACDIIPEDFAVPDVQCDFGDLNDKLSYDDNSFDTVVCLNGLQRVWARGRAVRELTRVIKPGGHIYISMPNHGDLRRRMLYFVTGSASWTVVGPPHVCPPEAEIPAAVYRYPMTLANVLSALESVGMELEAVHHTNIPLSNILMSPLALLLWIANRCTTRKTRNYFYLKASTTFSALFGAYLIVVAKKPMQTE